MLILVVNWFCNFFVLHLARGLLEELVDVRHEHSVQAASAHHVDSPLAGSPQAVPQCLHEERKERKKKEKKKKEKSRTEQKERNQPAKHDNE